MPFRINDQSVFNEVIVYCVEHMTDIFYDLLGTKGKSSKPSKPTEYGNCKERGDEREEKGREERRRIYEFKQSTHQKNSNGFIFAYFCESQTAGTFLFCFVYVERNINYSPR